MEFFRKSNFDFVGKFRWGVFISVALIVVGLISLILHGGPKLGIDFRGGIKIYAEFNRAVTRAEVASKLATIGYDNAKIQVDARRRSASIDIDYTSEASKGRTLLSGALSEGDGDWHALPGAVSIDEVGPSVGKDLRRSALWSIVVSLLILLLYISFRFEFRYSVGAIVALVHDVWITLGILSLLERTVNLPTLAAFLTLIGYSINDTIVVFDRIRENRTRLKGMAFGALINRSVNETLSRTIITGVTTMFVLLAMFFLTQPGDEINTFALTLIIGLLVGTYSSIFIASPLVYVWHLYDMKKGPQSKTYQPRIETDSVPLSKH